MRKVVVRLVLSLEFIIFANAKFGDGRPCALRPMLHDRLTSFDLAKSGKFTSGVKTSLVKLVLYPPGGHGLLTIFVTPGVFQNLARQM